MFLSMSYDWGDYNTARPNSYNQTSTGGPVEYAGTNIDYGAVNVLYGGNSKPIMTTDVQDQVFPPEQRLFHLVNQNPFRSKVLFSNLVFQEGVK